MHPTCEPGCGRSANERQAGARRAPWQDNESQLIVSAGLLWECGKTHKKSRQIRRNGTSTPQPQCWILTASSASLRGPSSDCRKNAYFVGRMSHKRWNHRSPRLRAPQAATYQAKSLTLGQKIHGAATRKKKQMYLRAVATATCGRSKLTVRMESPLGETTELWIVYSGTVAEM